MEVLESVEGSPHHSDMIPDCNGTETSLINCFSPNTSNITCDYLLVECRDPVTTEPSGTTDTESPTDEHTVNTDTESPTESSSGGVSIAVFAGVVGVLVVIIAVILIVTLLIVATLKKNKSRCMHELTIC